MEEPPRAPDATTRIAGRFLAAVTSFAVLASFFSYRLLCFLIPSIEATPHGNLFALLIPAVITPPLTWVSARERARALQSERSVRELAAAQTVLETQVKLRTAEAVAARDAAETANREKSRLIARLSHDLRTPLNAVIGFSDILVNAEELKVAPERRIEFARDIGVSGRHLLALVNRLLDLATVESRDIELSLRRIELSDALKDVAREMAPTAMESGVTIDVRLDSECEAVRVDPVALRQMLSNLTANAVRYSPKGGCVRLSARGLDADRVCIEVRDDGPGWPEGGGAAAVRVGGGDGDAVSGAGLGLRIVEALAELHGGAFERENGADGGALARLILPNCPERRAGGDRRARGAGLNTCERRASDVASAFNVAPKIADPRTPPVLKDDAAPGGGLA